MRSAGCEPTKSALGPSESPWATPGAAEVSEPGPWGRHSQLQPGPMGQDTGCHPHLLGQEAVLSLCVSMRGCCGTCLAPQAPSPLALLPSLVPPDKETSLGPGFA